MTRIAIDTPAKSKSGIKKTDGMEFKKFLLNTETNYSRKNSGKQLHITEMLEKIKEAFKLLCKTKDSIKNVDDTTSELLKLPFPRLLKLIADNSNSDFSFTLRDLSILQENHNKLQQFIDSEKIQQDTVNNFISRLEAKTISNKMNLSIGNINIDKLAEIDAMVLKKLKALDKEKIAVNKLNTIDGFEDKSSEEIFNKLLNELEKLKTGTEKNIGQLLSTNSETNSYREELLHTVQLLSDNKNTKTGNVTVNNSVNDFYNSSEKQANQIGKTNDISNIVDDKVISNKDKIKITVNANTDGKKNPGQDNLNNDVIKADKNIFNFKVNNKANISEELKGSSENSYNKLSRNSDSGQKGENSNFNGNQARDNFLINEAFLEKRNMDATISDRELKNHSVIKQIRENIEINKLTNSNKIVLKLEPEFLGKISVKMLVEAGELTAKFMVENSYVKTYLENHLSGLENNLVAKGLNVSNISIETENNSFEFGEQAGQGSWSEEKQGLADERKKQFYYNAHMAGSSVDGDGDETNDVLEKMGRNNWYMKNYIYQRFNYLV